MNGGSSIKLQIALIRKAPRMAVIPRLIAVVPVGRRVFKTPVLHQFGIEPAVSSIINIFVKNPDQHFRNRF